MALTIVLTSAKGISVIRKKRWIRVIGMQKKNKSKNSMALWERKTVKDLRRSSLRLVKHAANIAILSEASKQTPSSGETPCTSKPLTKRLRVMDVIKRKRRSKVSPFSTQFVQTIDGDKNDDIWKTVFLSAVASGALCGKIILSKTFGSILKQPNSNYSITWPISISVVAGMTLLFHAYSNYTRLIEAQKLWSKILGKVQDLMRMCMTTLTTTMDKRRFEKWLLALVFSLQSDLKSEEVIHEYLCTTLTPTEFFAIMESKTRVSLALQVLTDLTAQQSLDIYLAASMNTAINSLSSYIATLQALRDGFELNEYSKFRETVLGASLAAFSVASVGSFGVWAVPLTAMLSFLASCSNRNLKASSNPFQWLRLEDDCFTIKNKLDQMHLDHAQLKRIMNERGITGGSNVIPADNLTGELGQNKPSS